jgi:hypothetical protein
MVFKIEKDKTVFQSNPELQNFECLSLCSDKELKWLFWVYDYETPLRKMPHEKRIYKAADLVGLPKDKEGRLIPSARDILALKSPKLRNALKEFNILQFDQEKELIVAFDEEINQIIEMIRKSDKTDKEWSFVKDFNFQIPKIIKAKKELEESVGMRGAEQIAGVEEINDDKPLSLLDMLHTNEDY